MIQLAGFLGRRRRWVLAAWVAVVVVALPFASHQTDHLTGGGFDVPGSQSKAVSDSLAERLRRAAPTGSRVLLQADAGRRARRPGGGGRPGPRARSPSVDEVDAAAGRGAPRASCSCSGPARRCCRCAASQSSDELIDSADDLRDDLDPGTAEDGVTTYLAGQPTIWAGMQELSKEDLAKAEASGFPIVALILLVVFGSLAAAALPLALGFVSVIVTGALIYFISLQMTTSVFVTNMASMIGIGVAIDYSLFILARYREERDAGPRAATRRAPRRSRPRASRSPSPASP